jgi:pre-mRNA-splicing factor 38B
MYIRYTMPPADLFDWYEEFLQDEEEIDVKAGGGQMMTIGQMCRQFMVKLDWFSTLFPRVPVPIQKQIEQKLGNYDRQNGIVQPVQQQQRYVAPPAAEPRRDNRNYERPREREYRDERKRSRSKERRRYDDEPSSHRRRSHSREKYSSKSKYYDRDRSRSKERRRKYEDESRSSRRY